MMWHNEMYEFWWSGWLMMAVAMIAFSAVLIGGILVLARASRVDARNRTAHDLLDERFARGELDADEYRNRRDVLDARR